MLGGESIRMAFFFRRFSVAMDEESGSSRLASDYASAN
jgi:hypothetical protein